MRSPTARDTATAAQVSPAVPPRAAPTAPPLPPIVKPLSAETYKVQCTLTAEGHRRLRRAQDLLRHKIPSGDIAQVMEHALELLVESLERRKLAATDRPRKSRHSRPDTRHVPSEVRREVWQRDDGQCAFVGTTGRCTERGFLELHHVIPFAEGGQATVDNIQIRCRAHNQHEAELWFAVDVVRERPPVYGDSVRTELPLTDDQRRKGQLIDEQPPSPCAGTRGTGTRQPDPSHRATSRLRLRAPVIRRSARHGIQRCEHVSNERCLVPRLRISSSAQANDDEAA